MIKSHFKAAFVRFGALIVRLYLSPMFEFLKRYVSGASGFGGV